MRAPKTETVGPIYVRHILNVNALWAYGLDNPKTEVESAAVMPPTHE